MIYVYIYIYIVYISIVTQVLDNLLKFRCFLHVLPTDTLQFRWTIIPKIKYKGRLRRYLLKNINVKFTTAGCHDTNEIRNNILTH